MKLSPGQLRQFDVLGHLFLPDRVLEDEVALLRNEGETILHMERRKTAFRSASPNSIAQNGSHIATSHRINYARERRVAAE